MKLINLSVIKTNFCWVYVVYITILCSQLAFFPTIVLLFYVFSTRSLSIAAFHLSVRGATSFSFALLSGTSPSIIQIESSPYPFTPCQRSHQFKWKLCMLLVFRHFLRCLVFNFRNHRLQNTAERILYILYYPESDPKLFWKQTMWLQRSWDIAKAIPDRIFNFIHIVLVFLLYIAVCF